MSFLYRVNKSAYIGLGNTTGVSTIYTGTFGQNSKMIMSMFMISALDFTIPGFN